MLAERAGESSRGTPIQSRFAQPKPRAKNEGCVRPDLFKKSKKTRSKNSNDWEGLALFFQTLESSIYRAAVLRPLPRHSAKKVKR